VTEPRPSVAPTPSPRRRDPSRSAGLRRTGRSIVNSRVATLHRSLRVLIQEEDVPGLRLFEQPDIALPFLEDPASRLIRTDRMLREVVSSSIEIPLDDLITVAVLRGVALGSNEIKASAEINTSRLARILSEAVNIEVKGISSETQRRILRAVSKALMTEARTETLMLVVRQTLEEITRRRLLMMISTEIVRAVNQGKLAAYKAAGIKKVGIYPEWNPRPIVPTFRIPDAMVNILTAGDDEVCEDCEDIAGDGPYNIEEANDLIPAHLNCRCAFVPADDERYAEIIERQERQREEEDDN